MKRIWIILETESKVPLGFEIKKYFEKNIDRTFRCIHFGSPMEMASIKYQVQYLLSTYYLLFMK